MNALFIASPVRLMDLVLNEDDDLDGRGLGQDALELGQELMSGDDMGHFCLVQSMGNGIVSEVGIQGH